MKRMVLAILWVMAAGATAGDAAGKNEDTAAIKETALNYLEGWFSSDTARMEKALHPNLMKTIVVKIPNSDREYLRSATAEAMVSFTGHNQQSVKGKRFRTMKILHQDSRIAVVHAISDDFYDIINMVKVNGEWKILQVLWDMNQK